MFGKPYKFFMTKMLKIRLFVDDNQIYTNTLSTNDSLDLKFKLPKIIKNG